MNVEKIKDPWNPFNTIGYKVYTRGKSAEGCGIHYTKPDEFCNSLFFDKNLNSEFKVKSIDEFLQMFYKGLFICAIIDGEVRKTFRIINVDVVTDDIYPEVSDVRYIRVDVGYKDFNDLNDTNDDMKVFNYAVRVYNRKPLTNKPEPN